MTEIEKDIISYLSQKDWGYTKTIYKAVLGKENGYSLNKFRQLLELMRSEKVINYKTNGSSHPYWYLAGRST